MAALNRSADSLQQEAAGSHIAGGIFLSREKEIIGFFSETSQCFHCNRDENILMPIERGVYFCRFFSSAPAFEAASRKWDAASVLGQSPTGSSRAGKPAVERAFFERGEQLNACSQGREFPFTVSPHREIDAQPKSHSDGDGLIIQANSPLIEKAFKKSLECGAETARRRLIF
ncbi:hypothetical protein ACOME3_006064 [Neoechinorhynchus agilis]